MWVHLPADLRMVMHLESGEDVVIVRGAAEDLGAPVGVLEVGAAQAAKYTGKGTSGHPRSVRPVWVHGSP